MAPGVTGLPQHLLFSMVGLRDAVLDHGLWVDLRMAPRVSFWGSCFPGVSGTQALQCKHGETLRSRLSISTWSLLCSMPGVESDHTAKAKFSGIGQKSSSQCRPLLPGPWKGRRKGLRRARVQSPTWVLVIYAQSTWL